MPREGLQRYLPYAPRTAEGGARGETPLPLPTHRAVGRGSGPAGRDPPRAAGLSRGLPGTAPPGWEGCWGGRGGEPLGSSILRTLRAKGTRCPMFHLPPPPTPPQLPHPRPRWFFSLCTMLNFSPRRKELRRRSSWLLPAAVFLLSGGLFPSLRAPLPPPGWRHLQTFPDEAAAGGRALFPGKIGASRVTDGDRGHPRWGNT